MRRRSLLGLLAGGVVSTVWAGPGRAQEPGLSTERVKWVGKVLERMLVVKPGMTREALLRVFGEEGGLSTGLQETYMCRECSWFKVDVTYKAMGRPERDVNGRVTPEKDGRDEIVTISKPYVWYEICD